MGREENVSNLSDTPYAQPPQWEIKQVQMDFQCNIHPTKAFRSQIPHYKGLWTKESTL